MPYNEHINFADKNRVFYVAYRKNIIKNRTATQQ